MNRVYVVGVGMTPFRTPGREESALARGDRRPNCWRLGASASPAAIPAGRAQNYDYPQMVREAGRAALDDARIGHDRIEQAIVGHVCGDSTSAQRGLYELGLTGIPITGVTNNCSTGSTAVPGGLLARRDPGRADDLRAPDQVQCSPTSDGSAAAVLIDAGATTHGGKWVVNPSGGLISKGHPLGATGIAQCTELSRQLRGASGPSQVDGARIALQHNIGLGGAAVVTVYTQP